ncbi:DNA cross-link repair 1A, partial [Pristimantis euphronides]
MSDDEEEIWGYKSARRHRASDRPVDRAGGQEKTRKPGVQSKRGENGRREAPRKPKSIPTVTSPISPASRPVQNVRGPSSPEDGSKKSHILKTPSPVTSQNTCSGHCPSCQMPFSALLVQTPQWHVSECLDAPSVAQTECPDDIRCSSTLPSHYKQYSHFLLAQIRAGDQPPFSLSCTPDLTLPKTVISNGFNSIGADTSTMKKSLKLKSPKSGSPSSSQESVGRTLLDVWLSSPSKASQNSSSQETSSDICAAKCRPLPQQDTDMCDGAISYSPLVSDQELFSDDEGDLVTIGRTLCPSRCSPNKTKAIETPPQRNNDQSPGRPHDNRGSTWSQPGTAKMTGANCWSECSTPVSHASEWPPGQLQPEGAADLLSGNQHQVFPIKTQGGAASTVNAPLPAAIPHLQLTAQNMQPAAHIQQRAVQGSQAMPCVPSTKAMKQMDIGVFFGLKPKVPPTAAEMMGSLKTQIPNMAVSQREKPPKRKATGSFSDAGDVTENIGRIPVPAATGPQQRGGKRFRQNSNTEEWGRGKKQCPFYKKIPGTGFTVDAFQYGEIEGCSAYFLTHFHSDHYGGLTKKFRFPIYCSKITGNLVQSKLRVEKEFIHCLPMYTECTVNGIRVLLLDANHCPGAVLLLFILPNGTNILHTGDFRADTSMERYPALLGRKIHTLYLDTTYCSPEYTFPPQQEAVQFAVNCAFEMVTLHPRTLVVCGTYSVGKEKVFLAIADVLGSKVCMSQDKYKTMQCLESEEIRALVTTDWHHSALHVLPMMQVHFKGLTAHLNKFSGKYDRVLAFKPTGWTYSQGCGSVANIRPEIRGKVTVYGIPYSEHSSYSEMKRFVQFLKPQKIIPTVNVGNRKSRAAMEEHFAAWLSGSG